MLTRVSSIAAPCLDLTDDDKALWENWCEQNMEQFWKEPLKQSSLIIIDDPQLCRLIPLIRKLNPGCPVLYRSHIEINSELIEKLRPRGLSFRVWDYLWSNFISYADAFIAHPIEKFVPRDVPAERVIYMPATSGT